ncbi:GON-4-like protein isoform X1 [Vespa crabro]|uniref:GON-4-like protein isoform X1 n=1 Tax=Vespa crabro TaxID=7445 RepID=UPI001EFFD404|nr:GON-4-like protein isoform X1 [Vespa crabro]
MNTTKKSVNEEKQNSSIPTYRLNEAPKKCNLSFSINFDFDYTNSDNSSDSETADLQIDISEIDNDDPPTKHKRESVKETSVLNEMEEEIERQLDAKAAKTNLTATNVKNILKRVITNNEQVMAVVQKRLHDTEEDIIFEPKLTRAKAKELGAVEQVNVLWNTRPVKKPPLQVLIDEEFPEDSSDEEYKPEQDKQSDDDREIENSASGDIESQLPIPVHELDSAVQKKPKSPNIQYDPEGIFKIPCLPCVPTEEESIGHRTRSKLCLSETPLEQIEQAFVPPDITTDMYDSDCDEDWGNFLKEFTQPLEQEHTAEDDPEADPEYNILEDEETDLLDKEELRADKDVEITFKELIDLFEFTDTFIKQEEQEVSKKRKLSDNIDTPVEKNTLNHSELSMLVNFEQRHLLAIQFQQHVQLLAQHFAMTYMHPDLHILSKKCKECLNNIRNLNNGPNSAFNIENVFDALKLVSDWENKFLDPKFHEEFKKHIEDENTIKTKHLKNRWEYIPQFSPDLIKLFIESKALIYPQLLPDIPFKSELTKYTKLPFLKTEETLIAIGLEQFFPFVASRKTKFKSKKFQLFDVAQLIAKHLLPVRESKKIFFYIRRQRSAKDSNPIKRYFDKGIAPRIVHCITLKCDLKAPIHQPIHLLPPKWQNYLTNTKPKVDLLKSKRILNSYNDISKIENLINNNFYLYPYVSKHHPLRNPVVNVLPKIMPNSKLLLNNIIARNVSHAQGKSDIHTAKSQQPCDISNTKKMINKSTENTDKSGIINKEDKQSESINSLNVEIKNTKLTKKSSEALLQSPQIRKTTPRLAKTKSAQNMKLMAQGLGSKNVSNCSNAKTRGKGDLEKNLECSTDSSKVDNEDEIAELMLASTTIKKDNRKKAKQARELENIKRLLEADNLLNEGEREEKFAASYLQKLHLTLESNNPDILKIVIKLILDYNDKIENLNQLEHEMSFSKKYESSDMQEVIEKNMITRDKLAIDLYQNIYDKLRDFPELCSDLLLFLKPHQAALIGKSVEYIMLQKMSEFLNVIQVYFTKQPSRLAKIMQAITQLSSDPHVTLENVHNIMIPLLKAHPLVLDLFLQILPNGKPPESLFAVDMFENLTFPLGPHDKNKVYTDDAPELYENIELPMSISQEDPYGGDNCKCDCHNADDSNNRNTNEHCISCGTRFLNGRIYLQTSEGLRPAKITFPGADKEKLENIARVSLKVADKFTPPIASRQRRKSSKADIGDDSCQKQCLPKNSPVKENEDNERTISRSKRGTKSPPKSGEPKKSLKKVTFTDEIISTKKAYSPQSINKREKKIERKTRLEQNSYDNSCSESDYTSKCVTIENIFEKEISSKDKMFMNKNMEHDMKDNIMSPCPEKDRDIISSSRSFEKMDVSNDCDSDTNSEMEFINDKPWTRQEDMILLLAIKEEYSENTFLKVSQQLEDRTIEQVKERCKTLLSLLEQML